MVAASALAKTRALVARGGNVSAMASRRIRERAVPMAPELSGDLPPLLQRIYAARGIGRAAQVTTDIAALLPISSLDGVTEAAALLKRHRNGRILVVGDYDADGATSTALMLRALRGWGFAQVDFLVPDRFRFGYGLTPPIVALARERDPTLLVTVDNGIASNEGVADARAAGIDVLITDHHLAGEHLPGANVIVNPNLIGSSFGSRALAGVGAAFYVLAALQRQLQSEASLPPGAASVAQFLDLVALGTVADVVMLDQNNRILVAQGLQRIRAGRCVPGIRALLEVGRRELDRLVASDLGFAVGPRLNAAGRLDDMSIGIRCLLTDSLDEARALAAQLDELNRQRREIEGQMQEQALAAVRMLARRPPSQQRQGLVLYDADWHQGVVGLVASRVKDHAGRPVIAFAPAGDGLTLRGSGRSIAGVHIRDVIDTIAVSHPGLILRFGGHAMAAGLTIAETSLDVFARAFDEEIARCLQRIDPDDAIWTDGELNVADLCLQTAEVLREAGPWGQGFPEPCFHGNFEVDASRVVGEKHVKYWLRPAGSSTRLDAIAFNLLGEQFTSPPEGTLQLVYRLDVNHYQGERRLQLLVDHVAQATKDK
jgi:single-stranded-DNA-specific exonuclease